MQEVLPAKYYNVHETEQERYFAQTKYQTMTSGAALPKVHGKDKCVDLNLKPENK